MSPPVKVYYAPYSPPSRVVVMAAKALGVPLEPHVVDLLKGEHVTPQFLKINPQHTLPVIIDNDVTLNESRAIITYLADKYGKDDSLYPRDVKKRAIVNQRLYFDASTLFQRFMDLYYAKYFFGGASNEEEKKKKLDEAFRFLDQYLEKSRWVAGDKITLADIALVVSVSTAEVVGYEVSKFPNVSSWLSRAKTNLPGYEAKQQCVPQGCSAEAFKEFAAKFAKRS